MRALVSLTFLGVGGAALFSGCGDTNSSCSDLLTCETGGHGGMDASTGGEAGKGGGGASGRGGAGGASGSGNGGSSASGAGGGSGTSGAGGVNSDGGASGESGTSGASGTGGTDVDGGDGGAGCDETKPPSTEACLISDKYAVFVAAGAVNGTGAKESPLGTITAGIAKANERGVTHVIVCNATYAENVQLAAGAAAVGIYGGFSCPANASDAGDAGGVADWAYTPTKRPLIAPTTGLALTMTGVTSHVVISDVEMVSAAATAPGGSSIAAIVNQSANLALVRVKIGAGAGAAGASRLPGKPGDPGAEVGLEQKGKGALCPSNALQTGGSWSANNSCGSSGGGGGIGKPGSTGGDGDDGIPASDVEPPNIKNGGTGAADLSNAGTDGRPGSPGVAGVNGKGAATSGLLTAAGYTPADGKAGTDGHAGQGGGGGGGSAGGATCAGASGGAGGMGGCGGTHGDGGGGGGASIALLSWDSTVTLDEVELTAAKGGDGGKGGDAGAGGQGSAGALGGPGNGLKPGGNGEKGGDGGDGGSGSGGTGGPSYALVFHGAQPTQITTPTLTPGTGGSKGQGGALGDGRLNPAPDGTAGVAAPISHVQ